MVVGRCVARCQGGPGARDGGKYLTILFVRPRCQTVTFIAHVHALETHLQNAHPRCGWCTLDREPCTWWRLCYPDHVPHDAQTLCTLANTGLPLRAPAEEGRKSKSTVLREAEEIFGAFFWWADYQRMCNRQQKSKGRRARGCRSCPWILYESTSTLAEALRFCLHCLSASAALVRSRLPACALGGVCSGDKPPIFWFWVSAPVRQMIRCHR